MEKSAGSVVLPDTLVARMIDGAAALGERMRADLGDLYAIREDIRRRMNEDGRIAVIREGPVPLPEIFAVDGAHIPVADRASAYSISCAVRVSRSGGLNAQSGCLAALPHVVGLSNISTGFMAMQEIMLAVEAVEEDREAVCVIDGGRVSAMVGIAQFYDAVGRSGKQLQSWRDDAVRSPGFELGTTLARFESRDWVSAYLANSRIVGNLKFVTTNGLIAKYAGRFASRFDDKTLAMLVLEPGEAFNPVPYTATPEHRSYAKPFHIDHGYKYPAGLEKAGREVVEEGHPSQIYYVYYHPCVTHGVLKMEMSRAFIGAADGARWKSLLGWVREEIFSPDIQEPYTLYVADLFVKDAVRVAREALHDIVSGRPGPGEWAWAATRAYRTE